MKKLIYIIFCLLPGPILAQPGGNADRLFSEAEELLTTYRDGEAMMKYEAAVTLNPGHYQSLCQLVVLKSRIAGRTPDEAKKINYYHEAKDYAMKAYELEPNSAQSNYIMALGIGGVALVSSARQSLAYSFEMKDYLDKALELDPKHADSWHLLGRWHYKIANLRLSELTAANLFFGGIPEGASNEEAIKCLQKAIEYKPTDIIYYYDLARAYENIKDLVSCKSVLRTALEIEVTTSDELEIQRRCRFLLSTYEGRYQ